MLSVHSPLADWADDFRDRPQQREMATNLAQAILDENDYIAEASTGIGKTFAYLVPALLSGKRTVISTYTRHLQDQIYFKDLPIVLKAIGGKHKTTLLKGRSNYLCLEHLQHALAENSLIDDNRDVLSAIKQWAAETEDGDISLLKLIGEGDPLRSSLVSNTDNCLGSKCPYHQDCFIVKARNKALQSDLVIVNHQLLVSDMVLKEEGFGELLPDVDTVIVDEAHKFKSVSESSFSEALFSGRIVELLREIGNRSKKESDDGEVIKDSAAQCRTALDALVRYLSDMPEYKTLGQLLADPKFKSCYEGLQQQVTDLSEVLKPLRTQTETMENFWQRAQTLRGFLESVTEENEEIVVWVRSTERSFQIHRSPLDVSKLLAEKIRLYDANWIYTSATLTVGGKFDLFLKSQGLPEDSACGTFESPFDYHEQAAIYLPPKIPEPNHPDYTKAVIKEARPLLDIFEGRSFLLFTSHRALREGRDLLADQTDYQLLVQGDMPKIDLLEQFGDGHNRLLLGTTSFWEGVDVKGPALSCVIIDRLPFAHPGDPLTKARMKYAAQNNINFFVETTLQDAVIMLRQGVGRLIRSEGDYGVVMLADRRIRTKPYGKVFMDSLPPMKAFSEIEPLQEYCRL